MKNELKKLDNLLLQGQNYKENEDATHLNENNRDLADFYAKTRETLDIPFILEVEKQSLLFITNNELSTSSKFENGIESMNMAQDGFNDFKENPERYIQYTVKQSSKKTLDKEGLPLDRFRTSVESQINQLKPYASDDMFANSNQPTKERLENLKIAERLYKDKQRDILGIDQ